MDYKQICSSLVLIMLAGPANVEAAEATLAVASNFTAPANQLVEEFESQTDHEISLVFGSSGRFFAQISNGAPFDLFLSADQEKPRALIESNLAVAESLFTYALGGLVLWSSDEQLVDGFTVLDSDRFQKLALANSRLAPYGVAAEEVIDQLGLLNALQAKLVRGENIAQTYQFVFTGNAELGFVAKSQVYKNNSLQSGSAWNVPANLHSSITQDAVLLQRASGNSAALDFIEFLQSDRGRSIIQSFGYTVEE
ncbi:MAG: molybdate ABC transporter substrate-binding protein [Pseudomonadales bacterium]|nr:molybdate ABC transporter substrate-binding protein [Pseudomonadales bacterium]